MMIDGQFLLCGIVRWNGLMIGTHVIITRVGRCDALKDYPFRSKCLVFEE